MTKKSVSWLNQPSFQITRCKVVRVEKGFDCVPLEFCCAEMEKAWADDFIGHGPYAELCADREKQLCIYQATEFKYGEVIWDRMLISHCPFCGAGISVV